MAPFCLVAWWYLLPAYGLGMGHIAAFILNALGDSIENVTVIESGLFNTESKLIFVGEPGPRDVVIGEVMANIAPYFTLVLASMGLGLRRRIAVLSAGIAVLVLCHGTYLVLIMQFAKEIREAPLLPTVAAQIFITLPFLLWLVLVHWRELSTLLSNERA